MVRQMTLSSSMVREMTPHKVRFVWQYVLYAPRWVDVCAGMKQLIRASLYVWLYTLYVEHFDFDTLHHLYNHPPQSLKAYRILLFLY
jgi:hypothetical protein